MRNARLIAPLVVLLTLAVLVPTAGALSLATVTTTVRNPTVLTFRPGNVNPVVAQRNGLIVAVVKGKVRKLADLSAADLAGIATAGNTAATVSTRPRGS